MNIDEFAKFYRPLHSEIQIEYAVTARNGLTTYGMFKQTLRELIPRYAAFAGVAKKYKRRKTIGPLELIHLAAAARELLHFYKLAIALKQKLVDLDAQSLEQYEVELWYATTKYHAAVDTISEGRVSKQRIHDALCLPIPLRKQLLEEFNDQEALGNWVEAYDFEVPNTEHVQIDDPKLMKLIHDTFNPQQYKELIGSPNPHSLHLLANT